MTQGKYLLEMREISKSFYHNSVLDRINLRVKSGEIHGLLGKNGAGKTTLANILYGAVAKDSGEILLNGRPVEVNTVGKARSLGIIKIHQELNIFPKLTVAENIFVNAYHGRRLVRCGLIHREAAIEEALKLFAQLHFPLDPREKVENLGVAQQQMEKDSTNRRDHAFHLPPPPGVKTHCGPGDGHPRRPGCGDHSHPHLGGRKEN